MATATKAALQRMMNLVDDNAEALGSGAYSEMAKELQHLHDISDVSKEAIQATHAAIQVCETPMSVNTTPVLKFLKEPDWVQEVVSAKLKEHDHLIEQKQPRLATLLTHQWLKGFAKACIDRHSLIDEMGLCKIRWAIRALFCMRVGMLPYVWSRLNALGIHPEMLFPISFDVQPRAGDPGYGPSAFDCIHQEPRFLLWLLQLPMNAPWPDKDEPRWTPAQKALISSSYGRDFHMMNSPCPCVVCKRPNFRFMPYSARQMQAEVTFPLTFPIDLFPPMHNVEFVEGTGVDEPDSLEDYLERRMMNEHCTNPFRNDKPKWFLSLSCVNYLQVCRWHEGGLLFERPEGADMDAAEAEFAKVLREAEEEGYEHTIAHRVRTRGDERRMRKRGRELDELGITPPNVPRFV